MQLKHILDNKKNSLVKKEQNLSVFFSHTLVRKSIAGGENPQLSKSEIVNCSPAKEKSIDKMSSVQIIDFSAI